MARTDPRALLEEFENNRSRIIGELRGAVRTVASRFHLPPDLTPDDIAQEVLVVCLQSLRDGSFRGDSSIRTYAVSVAYNICVSRHREFRRSQHLAADLANRLEERPSPETLLLAQELLQVVGRVVRSLPEKCRELWRMLVKERKRYPEIAAILGVQEVTVRERLSDCRRQARELRARLLADHQQTKG